MRVIAAVAAASLVAVACGSGGQVEQSPASTHKSVATPSAQTSTPAVTQRAIGVSFPRSRSAVASLNRVVCPSLAGCVATFTERGRLLVLGERGGKWTRQAAPNVEVLALDCPSLGSCVGAGVSPSGNQPPEVMTQHGRVWHADVVPLPGNATPSFAPLRSVSCGSAGNCTAVGGYTTFKPGVVENHTLLVEEKGGTWGSGFEVQLPPDAATTPDVNGAGPGGTASVVSCASAGNCAAAGTYAVRVGDLNELAGWVASEQAGHWGAAESVRLPGGGTGVESFSFTGLVCPSVNNCTLVGGSTAHNGGEQGLLVQERHGVWLQGVRAPLPRGGEPPSEPNAFDDPLFSVSCGAPNDCAAIGAYVLKKHHSYPGTYHGWLLSERRGKWSASGLVLPRNAAAKGGVFLNQVNCPSRGNCVAVGSYNSHGKGRAFIALERRGKWQRAINAALPADAAKPPRRNSSLDSVSCASTSRCTVIGSYNNRSGGSRALIVSLWIH